MKNKQEVRGRRYFLTRRLTSGRAMDSLRAGNFRQFHLSLRMQGTLGQSLSLNHEIECVFWFSRVYSCLGLLVAVNDFVPKLAWAFLFLYWILRTWSFRHTSRPHILWAFFFAMRVREWQRYLLMPPASPNTCSLLPVSKSVFCPFLRGVPKNGFPIVLLVNSLLLLKPVSRMIYLSCAAGCINFPFETSQWPMIT